MTSVLSVGAPASDEVVGAVDVCAVGVEKIGAEAAEVFVKWTVRRAGPSWFFDLATVMGTAGLWYFRRQRQVRQKFLSMGVRFAVVSAVSWEVPSARVPSFLLHPKFHM